MADNNSCADIRPPKMPPSLYRQCVQCVKSLFLYINNSKWDRNEMLSMPQNIFVDLYFTMSEEQRWVTGPELWDLDMLTRVLKDSNVRHRLYCRFQSAVELNVPVAGMLADNFRVKCDRLSDTRTSSVYTRDFLIDLGLRLGTFLNEVGWYTYAQDVLIACRNLCQSAPRTTYYVRMTLECCHRLLHAQASYCSFSEASETLALSISLLEETCREELMGSKASPTPVNTQTTPSIESYVPGALEPCAGEKRAYCRAVDAAPPPPAPGSPALGDLMLRLYREFALLHFLRSDYRQTYCWSSRALKLLRPDTPVKITVDVLRICGKACVMMREFSRAGLLMREAVALARQWLGTTDPRYSLTLLDYGFYLLNVDSILDSVTVYEEALARLMIMFHDKNLVLAVAHEDLSYALYVHEYSSGRFFKAREHADIAIKIMEAMLPPTHLMLATAKRVKALILEEIALDTPPGRDSGVADLLAESETLHRAALKLSLMAFGEMNVQTAKHYGNLGRLYQSMQKFKEAEEMQLRAISIKEQLLGADDYEVGLSVGHLASLYNYHMNMYAEAEKLYFRSIAISLKLFGERYSGLEYDYLGLVHVNNELKKPDRADFYNQVLVRWRTLREQPLEKQQPAFGMEVAIPIPQLKLDFFRQDDED